MLKINRIMPFCNLFMGRPSYYTNRDNRRAYKRIHEMSSC